MSADLDRLEKRIQSKEPPKKRPQAQEPAPNLSRQTVTFSGIVRPIFLDGVRGTHAANEMIMWGLNDDLV